MVLIVMRTFVMPFTGRAIDPNDLELMRAAFNKVCDRSGLRCSREDPLTEFVVDTIIEMVATGARDPDRLCEGVVGRLEGAQGQPTKMDVSHVT
jgi:hypothetical protein